MSEKEGSDMPIDRAEFQRLQDKVDQNSAENVKLKTDIDNLKMTQVVQGEKISTLEKTLGNISTNVSRTFWAVVTAVIMMAINYFFNPPVPQFQGLIDTMYFMSDTVKNIISLIGGH